VTIEEPPERGHRHPDPALGQRRPQFDKRDVAPGFHQRQDQRPMRLDPCGTLVAALALGPYLARSTS
jgi:hypothetical protein